MLLLASASPARRRLLQTAGISHRVQVSGLDEDTITHSEPARLVQLLARAKALAVSRNFDSRWVIGADQVASVLRDASAQLVFEIRKTMDFYRATSSVDRLSRIVLSGGAWQAVGLVDLLASEYGWSEEQILALPIARAIQYSRAIERRRALAAGQKPIQFNPSDNVVQRHLDTLNTPATN